MGDVAARDVLIGVSAALATRNEEVVSAALQHAAEGVDPTKVDEVILQGHLFVGFPDALNALAAWRQIKPTAAPAGSRESSELWEQRGDEVCSTVYGRNYDKLRSNVSAIHPDLDRWMVVGGYGRVIGREGLDLVTRELCIVALLAVWGVPRQLHSHLRGALNAGATAVEVDRAVEIACALLDPPRALGVRALWSEVRERSIVRPPDVARTESHEDV